LERERVWSTGRTLLALEGGFFNAVVAERVGLIVKVTTPPDANVLLPLA